MSESLAISPRFAPTFQPDALSCRTAIRQPRTTIVKQGVFFSLKLQFLCPGRATLLFLRSCGLTAISPDCNISKFPSAHAKRSGRHLANSYFQLVDSTSNFIETAPLLLQSFIMSLLGFTVSDITMAVKFQQELCEQLKKIDACLTTRSRPGGIRKIRVASNSHKTRAASKFVAETSRKPVRTEEVTWTPPGHGRSERYGQMIEGYDGDKDADIVNVQYLWRHGTLERKPNHKLRESINAQSVQWGLRKSSSHQGPGFDRRSTSKFKEIGFVRRSTGVQWDLADEHLFACLGLGSEERERHSARDRYCAVTNHDQSHFRSLRVSRMRTTVRFDGLSPTEVINRRKMPMLGLDAPRKRNKFLCRIQKACAMKAFIFFVFINLISFLTDVRDTSCLYDFRTTSFHQPCEFDETPIWIGALVAAGGYKQRVSVCPPSFVRCKRCHHSTSSALTFGCY